MSTHSIYVYEKVKKKKYFYLNAMIMKLILVQWMNPVVFTYLYYLLCVFLSYI